MKEGGWLIGIRWLGRRKDRVACVAMSLCVFQDTLFSVVEL